MALTPTTPVACPAIDQLSPEELLRTASLFASDPDLPFLVDPDAQESLWVELDSTPDLNIWLLSWPAEHTTIGMTTASPPANGTHPDRQEHPIDAIDALEYQPQSLRARCRGHRWRRPCRPRPGEGTLQHHDGDD